MGRKSKYTFFYCDDCSALEPVISIFRCLYPTMIVQSFSEVENLILFTKTKKPEIILVYLSKPDHDFMTFVKHIRESVNSPSIPVVIYKKLPDEKELKELFKKIKM